MVACLYLWAFVVDRAAAAEALATGARVFLSVALIILSVFGLLGLFQVWVDKKRVAARLGEGTGLGTVVLAAAFGTVLAGPVYVVFPLLKGVRDHGARWAVVTAILAAWAVKIPMIPLEVRFLGVELRADPNGTHRGGGRVRGPAGRTAHGGPLSSHSRHGGGLRRYEQPGQSRRGRSGTCD